MIENNILNALRQICLDKNKFYALHEPYFNGNELKYSNECINTGWVSSVGKFVDQFEKEIASFTGVKYAIATVNGTAALHLSLLLAGVKPNDEVLTPALTFVATTNAIAYCKATPHFIDSDYSTLGINTKKLEKYLENISEIKNNVCYNKKTGKMIRAVVPMHTFGHAIDLTHLSKICKKYKLIMIEDAAEALGTYYRGKHVGNWGKLSAISFNGNKILTTGGGGMILTNSKKLAKAAKFLSTTAKLPHPYKFFHTEVGYNYRLPNINSAIGCAQMENINKFLENKRRLANKYEKIFKTIDGISFFKEPKNCKSNYWLNTLILDKKNVKFRDNILKITNDNKIMTRPAWTLMSKLPMYKKCPKMDLCIASDLEKRIINIPSSAFL